MSKTSAVVYVVDDDEPVRRVLAALVRSAGLRVQTFPRGVRVFE
jgi:FixJ family two-component response regulator